MISDLMSDGSGSRAKLAAQRIGELVRAAAPGARLGTKSDLRELCGVSVGTFNEALRLAQIQGLVVVRPGPGGGLFAAEQSPLVRLGNSVLALDADEVAVADAVRIRDALDPLLIADAAWHSSPADIARYRKEVAAMSDAVEGGDADAFMLANWRLHDLFTEVNPSPMLRSLYQGLIDIIRDHTLAVLPAGEQPLGEVMAERYRIHADLVEAIADRDTERVERLAHEHSVKPGSGRRAG
jgi:DNA-binding FadR family transcriptional regulator